MFAPCKQSVHPRIRASDFLKSYWTLARRQTAYDGTPDGRRAVKDLMKIALTAPEYSLIDRWHFAAGLNKGWETVYWQLAQEELRF
jgi:hypothetical protein